MSQSLSQKYQKGGMDWNLLTFFISFVSQKFDWESEQSDTGKLGMSQINFIFCQRILAVGSSLCL